MNILKKRNELLQESRNLQNAYFRVDEKNKNKQFKKIEEIRKKQNQTYKKWKFYDEFIKAKDKIK